MKTYNLIFSDNKYYRFSRHAIFWLTYWIFFEFIYFLPRDWYPAWNMQKTPLQLTELGTFKFYLLIISNSSLSLAIQMFFTYVLIYFLLPKYLLKERYIFFVLSLISLLAVSIILFLYEFKYLQPFIRMAFGRPQRNWTDIQRIRDSTDLVLLNCPAAGGIAVGIKLLKRWWLKQNESHQLVTAKASAELQLLKAQVHPHFLFNTLNNIYSFTLCASPKAPEMVKKLSGLLRYIIHECDHNEVPLEKELKMLQDYMGLEKIRYGDQMDMIIDIRGNYSGKMIAPLLLIPFIENSFKHGASKMLSKAWVNLNIIIEKETFYFTLNNSKPEEFINPTHKGGIGLANVQKRLDLLYPGNHQLSMTEDPQHFAVSLALTLIPIKAKVHHGILTEVDNHEMV